MNSDLILAIAQFVAALAFLIIIHELGHFLVARLMGVEIEEFGIGYPPRILTLFEAWGTKFSLNWLPIGGFVRPKGENDPEVPGGLAAANPWRRIAILAAGPLANLLAGVVLFALIFIQVGIPGPGPVEILEVDQSSPAELAGLRAGDLILKVNEIEIDSALLLQESINANLGLETTLTILRDETSFEVSLVPRTDPPPDQGAIGILMNTLGPMRPVSLGESMLLGAGAVFEQFRTLVTLPARLVEGSIGSQDLRPVGYKGMFDIYQNTRESAVQSGIPAGVATLGLFATISVWLGLFNMLPIPALDGGRILFSLPEILIRRRIPPAYESLINFVSLALLLLIVLYINIQDFVNPIQFR